MAYIGSAPSTLVSRESSRVYTYTATAGQTVFTGADVNNQVLSVTPSDTQVHMNGLLLDATDYTVTSSSVTLGTAANAGDELTVTGMVTFEVADTYDKTTADARYVNAAGDTMTGTLALPAAGLTVGTDQLAVDSAGRVTMPYQPAFYAYMDATGNSYNAILTYYYSTSVNVGSHFNPNTGYFTAPVAGRYLFNANIMTTSTNSYHFWRFYQNGSAASSYHHTAAGYASYRHSSGCAVLDLQVNDTVSIYLGASALYGSGGTTPWSSFSGYLIG